MQLIVMERVIQRLEQLVTEVVQANPTVYYDRLRALRQFIGETPALAYTLEQLPSIPYDFEVNWRVLNKQWRPGDEGYGMRWSAIQQIVDGGPDAVDRAWLQFGVKRETDGLSRVTGTFVIPIYHYLLDQLQTLNVILYILLRYKRWVEWFEARRLRELYHDENEKGEEALERDLRRFLFESGIDYPFSQPATPGGRADVVAALETDDPLVLEIKIWDSAKGYRENRIRDGLRQTMEYAARYGKDTGYIVVFNFDQEPLVFIGENQRGAWPAKLEYGDRTYFFIAIDVAEQDLPVSKRDRGEPVATNEVRLVDLIAEM